MRFSVCHRTASCWRWNVPQNVCKYMWRGYVTLKVRWQVKEQANNSRNILAISTQLNFFCFPCNFWFLCIVSSAWRGIEAKYQNLGGNRVSFILLLLYILDCVHKCAWLFTECFFLIMCFIGVPWALVQILLSSLCKWWKKQAEKATNKEKRFGGWGRSENVWEENEWQPTKPLEKLCVGSPEVNNKLALNAGEGLCYLITNIPWNWLKMEKDKQGESLHCL